MRNIKLTICYDGAAFHGYQQQPNGDTVEARLKDAIAQILGERPVIYGCSRTDAGVHAREFCCNFKTNTALDADKLQRALNAVLPQTVAVLRCEDVPLTFHARYDCLGKEYVYQIWNGKQRNPFLLQRALHVPFMLDEKKLNALCQGFVGTHDFAAYCASGSSVQSTVRTIYACRVERQDDLVLFTVRGNGFLYNMVRIMVGTLLDIHAGRLPDRAIEISLQSGVRENAGATAKAEGLILNRVFYEQGAWNHG